MSERRANRVEGSWHADFAQQFTIDAPGARNGDDAVESSGTDQLCGGDTLTQSISIL
ncbi:MAG: hypothetical protein MJE77_02085 [Proteobacteria bacterium]|nr:hypothetical protein [Pseudomonadota bacterium]